MLPRPAVEMTANRSRRCSLGQGLRNANAYVVADDHNLRQFVDQSYGGQAEHGMRTMTIASEKPTFCRMIVRARVRR